MALGGHERPHHGASDDWLTPPSIISALGPFDLDPCASVNQPWKTAACQWDVTDDELWGWFGFVWCNPPFSSVEKWLTKLADHGNGIGLVPARTETRWFINTIWMRADAILFLHRRPRFYHPVTGQIAAGNAGAPIVLVAYGPLAVDRLKVCGLEGSLVRYWRQSQPQSTALGMAVG